MNNNSFLRQQDLVDNPTSRIPICLCLDTSGSMYGQAIEELNRGVKHFYNAICEDELAVYSAEICIVTFGSKVRCVEDFANIERQRNVPDLIAEGMTPMGEGVNKALDLLDARKKEYQQKGVDYYQPWLVLMTDGEPNGSQEELNSAIERTRTLVGDRKLTVFPIGVGEDADLDVLKQFSPTREPLELQGLKFTEFFKWLALSVSRYSQSMPGDELTIDFASDWNSL